MQRIENHFEGRVGGVLVDQTYVLVGGVTNNTKNTLFWGVRVVGMPNRNR